MISVATICQLLGLPEQTGEVTSMRAITDPHFNGESIGWCADKNIEQLARLEGGYVLVSEAAYKEIKDSGRLKLLPVKNPRAAFREVLLKFFVPPVSFGCIHSSAIISDDVQMNKARVNIGPNVVIEERCVIGENVEIGANTVVKSGTVIGNQVKIGSNNTIGGVGFGYEQTEDGAYELIPHIGNVILGNNVEIGNNVCIDRAVLGSTILHDHVKVDNLVHIAHGVIIGRNSLIIANSMIAGSVEIGENVWISPSASIRQKLTVADSALVGMGAVVVKDVPSKTIVAGNPAKPFEKK